jgi:hypothetical protein
VLFHTIYLTIRFTDPERWRISRRVGQFGCRRAGAALQSSRFQRFHHGGQTNKAG